MARPASGLRLEQALLPGQPNEGLPRSRRPARRRAHDDDLPDLGLERLDPLAHGRRRHVQLPGRRVEGAGVDDGEQGGEVLGLEPHEAMLMMLKKPSLH